ncbi:LuxR C-terminal-related transcriptional regulator [Streptomyces sp. NPDC050085]|uniref:helix-turn-helix transcriptional regulator n=1 Tax=Streptomyces sp. NPDC050085 TaxID=3365600 RepID=UPI0037AA8D30
MSADRARSDGTGDALLWPSFTTRLREVNDALAGCGHVAISGTWGSGRSTLLAAVARSAPPSVRVLRLTPGPGDERYPLGALAQLLAPLARAVDSLPTAHAARLREVVDRPGTAPADRPALRTALAELFGAGPGTWLVTVDDAQWLDEVSAAVLFGAVRAVDAGRVQTAVARQTAWAGASRDGGAFDHVPRVRLGLLTLEETIAFVQDRGVRVGRGPAIHRACGGHPLLVRALVDGRAGTAPLTGLTGELPPDVGELCESWLASVPRPVRTALTPLALAEQPTRLHIRRTWPALDERHIADALAAGLLRPLPGDRVGFAADLVRRHAAAAISGDERAAAHRALAATATDPVLAARHELLSADRPTPQQLNRADDAARTAREGGDPALAADILLAAARRTPSAQRGRHLGRLTSAALDAGAAGRADLALGAARALAEARAGTEEVVALLAAVDASGQDLAAMDQLLVRARHLARSRPALLAAIDMRSAIRHNLAGRPRQARQDAQRAVRAARQAHRPDLAAAALTMQARIERITAHPSASGTLHEALALATGQAHLAVRETPQYLACRHAFYDDRLDVAETTLHELLVAAEASGSAEDLQEVLRSLAELNARRGVGPRAVHFGERALEVSRDVGLSLGPAWYSRALAALCGTSFTEAARFARLGEAASREVDDQVFTSRNVFVQGLVDLVTGRPARAVDQLHRVADLEQRQGVRDVCMLRWHPELVEALALAGHGAQAQETLVRHRDAAGPRELATGWGAGLLRAEAVLHAQTKDHRRAAELLERAAEQFGGLGLTLDRARTYLALSRTQRACRHYAAARRTAERAAGLFDAGGAAHWAALCVPTRPAPDERGAEGSLTEAETVMADAVLRGASNKEIAQELFVSVKTVEATLSRLYRKLDVRSRSQLAALLRPA